MRDNGPAPARILQLVHSNKPPFDSLAAAYERVFEGDVETVFLKGPGSLGFDARDLRGLKRAAVRRVRAIAQGYAFVVAHRWKALSIAARAQNRPVLGIHHQEGDYARWHRRRFVRARRDRIALLGVSDSVRDDLRAALPGVDIATLHHPFVPQPLAGREEARARLGLDDRFWFGCVARLHPAKDHDTLLRGFAQGPPDKGLALVGDGPLEGELRALSGELGIAGRVRFCGDVPGAARLYRAFDAFVLASRREGFGIVLLEAMAAGLPIVASDAVAEVVGGAGRLFPAGDAAALAAALRAPPVADPARIERFSPAAVRARFHALPFVGRFMHNAGTHGDTAARRR